MNQAIAITEFANLSAAVKAFIAKPKKLLHRWEMGGGRFRQDVQYD